MFNGKVYEGEDGWLAMLQDCLGGSKVSDRTGVGRRAIFDGKFICREGDFPFPTVSPAPLRLAFEEMWFFLRGETQTKTLESKGVNFWKGNTTRDFLDKRGLFDLEEGDMGAAYGYQLRGYNRKTSKHEKDVVDQLSDLYNNLKNDRYGSRHYVTLWNPSESDYMALTPCWHSYQFVVLPDENGEDCLHLKCINRSLDTLFGFRFAVQQYRLYQMVLAKNLGIKCGAMSCDFTHLHLYENQIEYAQEMLTRDKGLIGNIKIPQTNSLEEMLTLEWEDFKIEEHKVNTKKFKSKRPPMAV